MSTSLKPNGEELVAVEENEVDWVVATSNLKANGEGEAVEDEWKRS